MGISQGCYVHRWSAWMESIWMEAKWLDRSIATDENEDVIDCRRLCHIYIYWVMSHLSTRVLSKRQDYICQHLGCTIHSPQLKILTVPVRCQEGWTVRRRWTMPGMSGVLVGQDWKWKDVMNDCQGKALKRAVMKENGLGCVSLQERRINTKRT